MSTLDERNEALRAMKVVLSNMPHEEKAALVHVQRVRPELVNDEHLSGFLHAEEYDASVSLGEMLQGCFCTSCNILTILYFHLQRIAKACGTNANKLLERETEGLWIGQVLYALNFAWWSHDGGRHQGHEGGVYESSTSEGRTRSSDIVCRYYVAEMFGPEWGRGEFYDPLHECSLCVLA